MTTGLDNPTETVTLTTGDELDNFGIGETWRSEGDPTPGGSYTVTAIDREAGTITLGSVAKRLLADTYEVRMSYYANLATSGPGYQTTIALDEPALPAMGATGAATIAVVTTVAALEWLRHRKAAVAAAEGSDEAYRSLLSEFLIWLSRWLDGLGRAGA